MKIRLFLKIVLFFNLMLALILPTFLVSGQEMQNSTNTDQILASTNNSVLDPVTERQQLEEELKKLEEEMTKLDQDISKTEAQRNTLKNQISLLTKKIAKLDIQIKQANLMIQDLGLQIKDTESSIEKTTLKIEDSQSQLVEILRTTYEKDQVSLLEILLSEKEFSDFFDDLVSLENLNYKNQELLQNIKDLKINLESQKQALDGEKTDLESTVKIQVLQKQASETTKKEQNSILNLTEAQYQKYLKDKEAAQKKATEIRARLFELIGVPHAPTFGEAYDLAKEVEKITNVRPAFLLAVLTQESNIGKNVGQCYLVNLATGEGIRVTNNKSEPKTMSPSRDVPKFVNICAELGRDPLNTPVSCPMSFGWGGAMGPAQFIPSTWVLYKDRVKEITGKAADPWNIKDSFLAAALYLADYGAKNRDYNSEWRAAMIYFSGSTNSRFRFYGDSVIATAKQYEQDIKELEGLAQAQ